MAGADELAELRGEIVALETALAAAFGEIAALQAAMTGGGAKAAGEAMDAMATDLERLGAAWDRAGRGGGPGGGRRGRGAMAPPSRE